MSATGQHLDRPNFRCRDCDGHVFRYCSPAGAIVDFDFATPPWRKHQCPESVVPETADRNGSSQPPSLDVALNAERRSWKPLFYRQRVPQNDCDLFYPHARSSGLSVPRLKLPMFDFRDRPIHGRPAPGDERVIELSTFGTSGNSLGIERRCEVTLTENAREQED